MRLMRFGPSMLFLRTSNIEEGEKFIGNLFSVSKTSVDDAWNKSGGTRYYCFCNSIRGMENYFRLKERGFLDRDEK
ncbi:hypothetical protein [Thermococcus sp.]|uniref:hypothetical protein n=1 Tax=Thermococcus sp. TaxID=35749 RepID=UPI00318358E4